MHDYCATTQDVNKFVYIPKKRYEDKDVEVTQEELDKRFGKNSVIDAYEYDPKFFNDTAKALNIPTLNKYHQQPQRILSFFNHIKKSLELLENASAKYNDETVIFLCRSDMGIKAFDLSTAKHLLKTSDIIVEKQFGKAFRDFFFVFKKRNINVFLSLYESYKKYTVDFYKNVQSTSYGENPESMFYHHFQLNNAKVVIQDPNAPVLEFRWRHVCSEYCGHNEDKTKILGEEQ